MALSVKDGNGTLTSLKTTLTGSDHMPHHVIQEISGSNISTIVSKLTDISSSAAAVQTVTASLANPVYVTGAVQVSQPVSVDLVIGDNVFVTSSLSAPLYVSSSNNSPILITGTVNVDNYPAITTVTASTTSPVPVTGTINAGGYYLNSINDSVAPLSFAFTSSGGVNYIRATASNSSPVTTVSKKSTITNATKTVHNQYTIGDEYIDYTSSFSGTFIISSLDINRSTLILFNPSAYNLYISVGSGSDGPNGFQMLNTSSAPLKYSFILYPSGTYIADDSTVSAFHSGFFISSSTPGFSPEAISTKVSY
jgi:hypothetical protein